EVAERVEPEAPAAEAAEARASEVAERVEPEAPAAEAAEARVAEPAQASEQVAEQTPAAGAAGGASWTGEAQASGSAVSSTTEEAAAPLTENRMED
ncbi:MAG: hypothetical protein ABR972_06145, partial [Acidimicrobiales bacterium]